LAGSGSKFRGTALPDIPAQFRKALAAHQRGDIAGAASQYQAILRAAPNHAEALNMLGVVALQSGQADQGIALIGRAVALKPNYADAQYNLAVALTGARRFAEALPGYDKVVTLAPRHADAWMNRGAVLAELGRHEDAIASYDRAIACRPNNGEAFANRAVALCALRRFDEAAESCTKAIAIRPDHAEAYCNRAVAMRDQRAFAAALADCDRAIALRPDFARAHANRGSILGALSRFPEALAACDAAITLDPGLADAYCHRGTALGGLSRWEDALASCDRAAQMRPDFAHAHAGRADALRMLRRFDAALTAYDTALTLRPNYTTALANRGALLRELNRLEEATRDFTQALRIDPDIAFTRGDLLFTRMQICAWDDIEQERQALAERLAAGHPVSQPFPVVAAIDSPILQRRAAELWVSAGDPVAAPARHALAQRGGGKIRLGYYSSDYRNHATAHLAAGLFETHDRNAFEVIGFSFGPDTDDPIRGRIRAAFDRFIDADPMPDQAVADVSRDLGIDIAIDLNGLTRNARTGVFASRAAPVQINYLGYPGTMGADFMDYIVADRTVITDDSRAQYAEKIIYLPHSYQINDATRQAAGTVFTRAELGLPEAGFVFCCFNNNYKILPDVFDSWMRILQCCAGSVLWLLRDNDLAANALRREAAGRGIDPARLIFAPRLPVAEHLARHMAADLFLDTLPYNAHTTASDALWMGLPVLTRMGRSFASRVAASLLRATGLTDVATELVTETAADYEQRAVQLASNPAALQAIRARLMAGRAAAPLFDTARYVRHLENAYRTIQENHLAGRAAADIFVAP
jgi:protein O-GlcNAc transferase